MPRRRSLLSPLDFPCSPPPPQSVLLQKTLQQQQQQRTTSNALKPSILTIAIIITLVFLISTSIHLLLRFFHRLYHSQSQSPSSSSSLSHPQVHPLVDCPSSDQLQAQELIDSLPVFSFNSVAQAFQKSAALDCAVCLSRFEPHDQLRILPSCCHAFHSSCIDAWLLSNLSCPLCRTTVSFYEFSFPTTAPNGEESFRLEIGSISQRGDPGLDSRRTYSMGSFDYVVDDDLVAQVDIGLSGHRMVVSDWAGSATSKDKEEAEGADVAEAAGGRGWLKEYVDRLASSASSSLSSSRAISFRLSGRSGGGSSRRNDGSAVAGGGSYDMDSSFSRWLTGA